LDIELFLILYIIVFCSFLLSYCRKKENATQSLWKKLLPHVTIKHRSPQLFTTNLQWWVWIYIGDLVHQICYTLLRLWSRIRWYNCTKYYTWKLFYYLFL